MIDIGQCRLEVKNSKSTAYFTALARLSAFVLVPMVTSASLHRNYIVAFL